MKSFPLFLIFLLSVPMATTAQIRTPKDSLQAIRRFSSRQKIRKISVVPVALMAAGALAMSSDEHTLLNKRSFQTEYLEESYGSRFHIEDYTRDLPIVAVYALNLSGVKGKNTFMERSILLAKTMLIQHILVSTLKNHIDMERPDGGTSSFPSSHTARAFAAATFMHYEYGEISPWYSIGAYSAAALTGYLRMAHNHHWVNDVLIGAGIGVLSANIAYHTHQFKWTRWHDKKGNSELALVPMVSPSFAGLAVIGRLK